MNLFTSIVRSVHKRKTQLRASCRRKRHEIVLSSEQLEPRHYLSADGLVQDPAESWSVTYAGLTDGSQRPYTIGSGYSSSNLNQAENRPIGLLAYEFSIDSYKVGLGGTCAEIGDIGGVCYKHPKGIHPSGLSRHANQRIKQSVSACTEELQQRVG